MTEPAATPFARHLDGLVESARAARDSAFNTLDAVNRQTRSASDALVREAQQLVTAAVESAADRSSEEDERDARFDPEDDDSNYPETDYPDTWLR